MQITYQYRIYLETEQKILANQWLRSCRFLYNYMLGKRINWWEQRKNYLNWHKENICDIKFSSTINTCSIAPLKDCPIDVEDKDNPTYNSQQNDLPNLKEDLILVEWSKELIDLSQVDSTVLQNVCKRLDNTYKRYLKGDSNGKKSGKPRFKTTTNYKSFTFQSPREEWLDLSSLVRRKNKWVNNFDKSTKWKIIYLPKIGLVKIRTHRPLPVGFKLKQVTLIKKADGWYISLNLEDKTIPEFTPDNIKANWDNSIGLDAVLKDDIFLATSEGNKLNSLKPLRKSQAKLTKVSQKKNKQKKGSKIRRKLAKKEGKIHQQIARERKDFHYKTAHQLIRTNKKVFFVEDLNLVGLSKRNKVKQDNDGKYLPNGQAAKSGLNKSWKDAAFGQFFEILGHIAVGVAARRVKAGAKVEKVDPKYTSQLLAYKDELIFIDLSIREY